MKEGRIRPSLPAGSPAGNQRRAASMKEGRIRPSLRRPFVAMSRMKDASMKEGRIRPSLPRRLMMARMRSMRLNEGGSNSTLVAPPRKPTPSKPGRLNEGGSNSTLVDRTHRRNRRQHVASMKEGRIRPSLPGVLPGLGDRVPASMKEGRIRPSLPSGASNRPAGGACLNEGGSNSTLVDHPRFLEHGDHQASMKEGRIRPSLRS